MKIIRLATLSFAAVFGSLVTSAQQASSEAFVSSVTGTASFQTSGSSKSQSLVAGQKLPEGTTITTSQGGSVIILSHQGIETGLGEKTTATIGTHSVSADGVRTAVIDLKQGTTVSVLDPSKRSINNYAVRTPKGVAAARGTTYSTTVSLSSGGEAIVTVNTITGAVSFSIVGGATIAISEGNSANSNSGVATTIAAAINAASPAQKQDIADALKATVQTVATMAQTSSTTGETASPATLTSVVTSVTQAANEVAQTNPALANTIVASTIVAVQQYAGANSDAAVAVVQNNASPATQQAANNAAANPAPPVEVSAAPAPAAASPNQPASPSPNTGPAANNPNQQPAVDPTIPNQEPEVPVSPSA